MDLLLSANGDAAPLRAEIVRAFPAARVEDLGTGLMGVEGLPGVSASLPPLVFLRQLLPDARFLTAGSIRDWAKLVAVAVSSGLLESQPWRLHAFAQYEDGHETAGARRCELVREALVEILRRRHRGRLRRLEDREDAFAPEQALVQLFLTAPDRGFLSISPAPAPYIQRRSISPFPSGALPVAVDKAAPSRAFAKLIEAERRLGHAIAQGETCADLGASPGSWSYVALRRGAQVVAVDRSDLRADLMRDPALTFRQGDAFRFRPDRLVDWLLCDVIAAPARSIGLLLQWLENAWCRHFVVTIKFQGSADYAQLDELKRALPDLCDDFILKRLCANRNEACAAGQARSRNEGPNPPPIRSMPG